MVTGPDGKSLADHVALTIGLVGENMVLKRAVLMSACEDMHLSGMFPLYAYAGKRYDKLCS